MRTHYEGWLSVSVAWMIMSGILAFWLFTNVVLGVIGGLPGKVDHLRIEGLRVPHIGRQSASDRGCRRVSLKLLQILHKTAGFENRQKEEGMRIDPK